MWLCSKLTFPKMSLVFSLGRFSLVKMNKKSSPDHWMIRGSKKIFHAFSTCWLVAYFKFYLPMLHETWCTGCARLTFFTRLTVRTSWIVWLLNTRHTWYAGLTLWAFCIAFFAKAFDTVLTFQTLLTLLASLTFRWITILARRIVYTWNARNTWCTTQAGLTIIASFTIAEPNHIRLWRTWKITCLHGKA